MKETMIRIEIESGRFISSVNNARRWDPDFSRLFRPVIEFSHTDRERKREKYMKRERERHKTIHVMLHNIGRDVSVWYTESEREREEESRFQIERIGKPIISVRVNVYERG